MRPYSVGSSPALCLFLLLPFTPAALASEIRVVPGAIEDTRSNSPEYAGLSLEIKLEGAGSEDVEAVRIQVKSAKDNLGSSLFRAASKQKRGSFDKLGGSPFPPKIVLANPPRDASSLNISLELEMFVPKRDPAARLRLDGFLSRLDKPLAHSTLKSAKVEVIPLSQKEYLDREAKNRPTREQLMARAKEDGLSEKEVELALGLMEAFSKMGEGEGPAENDVYLETKDPDYRLIDWKVIDKDGNELPSGGSQSTGADKKLWKLSLREKPPADAALLLTIRTSKATVSESFELKEVALP